MKRVIVGGTSQYDPAKALVGSSPYPGDMTSTGIVLPATPTVSQSRRYLGRLFALEVQQDEYIVIEALHQLLTIGVMLDVGGEQDPTQYPLEIPVTDPTWSFIDGNVSWHLRKIEPQQYVSTTYYDVPFPAPFASDRTGMTSAILARVPAPYLPLNGGAPYGKPIGTLGTFRDMRYPWGQADANLKERVDGPCQVVLFASIWQTNPDTRVQPLVDVDGTYLRQEDRFVINHPQSRYWRIGARMEVDVFSKVDPLARA